MEVRSSNHMIAFLIKNEADFFCAAKGDEGIEEEDEEFPITTKRSCAHFRELMNEVVGNFLEDKVCDHETRADYQRFLQEQNKIKNLAVYKQALLDFEQNSGKYRKNVAGYRGKFIAYNLLIDKKTLILGLEDVLLTATTEAIDGYDKKVEVFQGSIVLGSVRFHSPQHIDLHKVQTIFI